MKTALSLLVTIVVLPPGASAQTPSSVPAEPKEAPPAAAAPAAGPSAWDVFSKYFQVRKGFDGSKSESEAAAIGVVAPGNGSASYWLVDAGLRTTPFDIPLNQDGDFELFAFPSVEWHHMNAEPLLNQSATNKAGPSFTAELWFPAVTSVKLHEHVVSKASLQRNFIKDTTENSATIALETCAEGVETHENGGWGEAPVHAPS